MRRWSTAARLAGVALAMFAVNASPALAQKVASDPNASPLSGVAGPVASSFGAVPLQATLYDFDVSGIFSNDALGDPINERRQINVGANALITGIGWNVTLFADSPSWLSEMVVAFGNTAQASIVNLTPGVGVNSSGTQTFDSNGIVDLVGLNLAFNVGADGILSLEFFESFDDFPNEWDGIWESGLLTIEATTVAVPEPATLGLLALGLLAAAARRRRTS